MRLQEASKNPVSTRELRRACIAAGLSSNGSNAALMNRLDSNFLATVAPQALPSGCATSPAPTLSTSGLLPGASSPDPPPAAPHQLSGRLSTTPPTSGHGAGGPLPSGPPPSRPLATARAPDAAALDDGRRNSPTRPSRPPTRSPRRAGPSAPPRAINAPVRRRLRDRKHHGSLTMNFVGFSMSCASQAWPLGCMRPGGRSLASSLMHEWPGGTCGPPW